MPIALPRSRGLKVLTIKAPVEGTIIAAPTPCRPRAAMIHAPLEASPHSAEAATNSALPARNVRSAPSRSAIRPPSATSTASTSRYALTTHCSPAEERPRSFWIVGSATDTTVWSIMIIDSAPVIVASTHQRRVESAPVAGSVRAVIGLRVDRGSGSFRGHGAGALDAVHDQQDRHDPVQEQVRARRVQRAGDDVAGDHGGEDRAPHGGHGAVAGLELRRVPEALGHRL